MNYRPPGMPLPWAAHAHFLAQAGLPVFPCGEKKVPLVTGGHTSATIDLSKIREWWKQWPDAIPGVPMGPPSGLFAVDADIDRQTGADIGAATLRTLGIDPSSYPYTARTRSGGAHLLYRWQDGLPRNSTKTSNGLEGVDVRSDGGYIIAWDPKKLIAAKQAPQLEPPPSILVQALTQGRNAQSAFGSPATLQGVGAEHGIPTTEQSKWAERALSVELTTLWVTSKGGRNNAVNICAFKLGQIVGAGLLSRQHVEAEIWRTACGNGIGKEEPKQTLKTIKSGIDAGVKQPRFPQHNPAHDNFGGIGGIGGTGGTILQLPQTVWPELVPFANAELPSLSQNMLGSWIGEFAAALSEATETPFELAASLTLGVASTAAARRVRVRIKRDYFEPCNLWLLVSLGPGNRKSAVEAQAASPLRHWERDAKDALAGLITEASIESDVIKSKAKELKSLAGKTDDEEEAARLTHEAAVLLQSAPLVPRPPRLWTSDSTPERLGTLLADHDERMAWLSAEGGFFDIAGGRYSKDGPNLDLLLKAHAGDAERVDRLGRDPVFLREPLLTVALSPQPSLLRGLVMKPGFRGRGLLGRFLYFLPISTLGWRTHETQSIPEHVVSSYHAGVQAMLNWSEGIDAEGDARAHILKLSPEAYDAWLAFAKQVEVLMRPGSSFEHAPDWAGKAPGATARLAGVLHAADHAHDQPWKVEIPRDTMERAIGIVSVSAHHTLAALHLMAADEAVVAAEKLWAWIERNRRAKFTTRDAWQGLKGTASFSRMADVDQAFRNLVERGYVVLVKQSLTGSGRPASPTVWVRPELCHGWG